MVDHVYDEYQEAFGDSEGFNQIKNLLSKIGDLKCEHRSKSSSGKLKYCTDCGIVINEDGKAEDFDNCKHEDIFENDNGLHICRKCCVEIEIWSFAPEWRYYGSSDNRVNKDPSRCHYSKGNNKGLENTFAECGIAIPMAIKKGTEQKYNKIIERLRSEKEKNTVRGKRKKSIVAACLLHTYREAGEVRTATYIREFFDLKQKSMSRGLLEYSKTFPKDRTASTSPENLLRWQMTLSGIHISHYRNILAITKYLEDTSQNLKRSNPQSVSAAILYFYLCLNPQYKAKLGLTKTKFASRVNLSDITITKLVREVARVSKCQVQV